MGTQSVIWCLRSSQIEGEASDSNRYITLPPVSYKKKSNFSYAVESNLHSLYASIDMVADY